MKRRCLSSIHLAGLVLLVVPAWADAPVLPGAGFDVAHYEALWTKSPFSVSSEAGPESPDYALVGIAQFDGIYYVSLIDQKNQEHFLVSTSKPARGLVLVSVTPGHGTSDAFAMLQRDGQPITLKMQAMPNTAPPPPNGNPPAAAVNQPPVPGSPAAFATQGVGPASAETPPPVRIRRPSTRVPPRPP